MESQAGGAATAVIAPAPERPQKPAVNLRSPLVVVGKGLVGVIGACFLWEVARSTGFVNPQDLPSLSAVFGALAAGLVDPAQFAALGATMFAWLIGLVLAVVVGAFLGVLVGLSPAAEVLTRPIFEFIRPIPSVALIPVALIVVGTGLDMEVGLIAFASLWPVLFNVKAAVESTDPRYLESGRILGHSTRARILKIVLPNALPALATGVRTAAAIALVLAITVEMITGQMGLGQLLQTQRLSGASTAMWATVFLCGAIGYLINVAFLVVERTSLKWSTDVRDA